MGVYHGPQSGHLVVHCNSRVLLIDFHVLQAKTYSFLIDNQLCELRIAAKDGHYDYVLDLNDPPDPLAGTEQVDRRQNYYALGTLLAFFIVIYLLTIWLRPFIPA